MAKLTEKQKIRRLWVRALRSGKYKQTTGNLRTQPDNKRMKEGGYCCLGVLCELAVKAKVIPPPTLIYQDKYYAYKNQTGSLPFEVKEWAGLSTGSGDFTDKKGNDTDLTKINDDGASFKRIAKIIESEPEGLFE